MTAGACQAPAWVPVFATLWALSHLVCGLIVWRLRRRIAGQREEIRLLRRWPRPGQRYP